MHDLLMQLAIFSSKILIVLLAILILCIGLVAIFSKGKSEKKGQLKVKHLNQDYTEASETILFETFTKQELKTYQKQKKAETKAKDKKEKSAKKIYVLNFNGDIKASAVGQLTHEINAILTIIKPKDEVVVRLESAGGVVHGYGLAAAQLMRLRDKNISLTVFVDKVAASGGYLMAVVANKIYAAPFAIIGSIGVIMQMPNFNRLLKAKNIDFEQQTAGEYKRTLTMFGENTEEGRQKLHQELEHIHTQFKELITTYRDVDLKKVATGEHWLAKEAINYGLIDGIQTSDAYLFEQSKTKDLYEISYQSKKSLLSKFTASAAIALTKFIS